MKSVKSEIKEPVVVFRGPYANDYSVPGYKLSTENKLVFDRMVTEEDAWKNDVYVVGPEENVEYVRDPCVEQILKDGDVISLPCDDWGGSGGGGGSTSSNIRKDGRAEYGGRVQVVTNLNDIEHWINGKLEFRMVVAGVKNNAATVINDIPFPKRRRKNFKNRKWYDYNQFLFNWNKSNLGNFNVEKWIERDGGSSTTVSISVKPKDAPAVSLSVTVKSEDQDLGQSIVQFTDPLTTVYGLGMVNFKRK